MHDLWRLYIGALRTTARLHIRCPAPQSEVRCHGLLETLHGMGRIQEVQLQTYKKVISQIFAFRKKLFLTIRPANTKYGMKPPLIGTVTD